MKLQHHIAMPQGVDILDMDVALSNALNLSSQGLSLPAKRLVGAALAKMGQPVLPKLFKASTWTEHEANWSDWLSLKDSPFSVVVSAADYAKAANINVSTAYSQLKEAVDSLWESEIKMNIPTPAGIKEVAIRWVSLRAYHEGEGYAELFWSPQVARHIFDLRNKFTAYKLRKTSNLQSVYSMRLFEQFVTYAPGKNLEKPGIYRPTMEEFNFSIGVPESYHKDFAGTRRRIIEPAVAELVKQLGLHIEWSTKTRGRKVVGLVFVFAPAIAGDQTVLAGGEAEPINHDE